VPPEPPATKPTLPEASPASAALPASHSSSRARQGLHSSPSWPRGLTCRRPPSAVPAAADIRASALFAFILFCTKERHARTLQLITAMPATVIGFESASRPARPHPAVQGSESPAARAYTPPFICVL